MGYITPTEFRERFPVFTQSYMMSGTAWNDTVLERIIERQTNKIKGMYSNYFPNDYKFVYS